jgi:hypothetical protein
MRDERVKSFCDIAGSTGAVVAGRWIVTGSGEQRHVEVCWKHAEGELDPGLVESLTAPPAG